MAEFRTLACVGLNGFERARLRLLLGEAGQRLNMPWKLGRPGNADVLLLAEQSAEANAASITASGRGVRCVRMGPAGAEGDENTLPTGFDIDDLVRVLSGAGGVAAEFRSLDATAPEFFETSSDAASATDTAGLVMDPDLQDHQAGSLPEPVDLERFLRRESGEYTLESLVPYGLKEDTAIEPVQRDQASSRAEVRSTERNPFARTSAAPPGPAPAMVSDAPVRNGVPGSSISRDGHPLLDYLSGELLMAPCQLVREDAEPLILDPKNQVYMIVGDLASVEAYLGTTYAEPDFERLTTRELERWRALCEARPYLRLQWLIALRSGDGWLPRHLDPGGSYRLRRMLDLDEHFDDEIRIGQVLQDWRRLHEVTAQAGVDMQAVFHTVAAYDAIGWLEWKPRERFRK